MAYFSNGTEGMDYESRYCDKCVNFRDEAFSEGKSCPIWDLHHDYNYDQLKNGKTAKAIRTILNRLIPETEKGFAAECSMFVEAEEVVQPDYLDQLRFADEPVYGLSEV